MRRNGVENMYTTSAKNYNLASLLVVLSYLEVQSTRKSEFRKSVPLALLSYYFVSDKVGLLSFALEWHSFLLS